MTNEQIEQLEMFLERVEKPRYGQIIDALDAAIATLRKLPVTKDGVIVVDGDVVYRYDGREMHVRTEAWRDECVDLETDSWEPVESTSLSVCYSTSARAAAEKETEDAEGD